MSDKPAAYQLGIYISVVLIIVFGLFTYWSYNYNKMLIRKNAESIALNISTKIIGDLNEKLIKVQEVSITLSEQLIHHHSDKDFLRILENLLSRHEFITSIQVLTQNIDIPEQNKFYFSEKFEGGFFSESADQRNLLCYEVERVLNPLFESEKPVWSEPFVCPRNSNLAVLYYFPFNIERDEKNENLQGYVSCEISLDFLNRMILDAKVGENGFAFLISSDGTYLTHPIKEYILNRNLFNLPERVFKGEKSQLQRFMDEDFGSLIVYPDPLQNKKSIAFHAKIKDTGWILSTVFPYRELFRDLYWLIFRMVALTFLVVTVILGSVFYISNKVMKPLSEVTHQIHKFSTDSHDHELQIRNEAEALSHSLKRLRKTYEKLRMNEAESLEKSRKIQVDMQTASEIQKSIIPPQGLWRLNGNGLSLYSVFKPVNIVSGDLYDFFMVDEKHFLITIGDVSGSGVPAALFMGVAHTFIKSYAHGNSAKTIVKKVNSELCRNNTNQFFLTLFLGILNIEEGTFNYCNAGHTPVYHIKNNGKVETLHKTHGLPLGLFAERIYEESTIQLSIGDKLVLVTDGVTDQTNNTGEYFGDEHLRAAIRENKKEPPEKLAENLMEKILQFSGNNKYEDDLSLIVFMYEYNHKMDPA